MILDSGNRTEFVTEDGKVAVRDLSVGKGRTDLLPLDIIGDYYEHFNVGHRNKVIDQMYLFMQDRDVKHLYIIIEHFCLFNNWRVEDMLLELSVHFEEGAAKYKENQWKGIPVWSFVNSALRHYFKHQRGDKDESHAKAFIWNLVCLAYTVKHEGEQKNE